MNRVARSFAGANDINANLGDESTGDGVTRAGGDGSDSDDDPRAASEIVSLICLRTLVSNRHVAVVVLPLKPFEATMLRLVDRDLVRFLFFSVYSFVIPSARRLARLLVVWSFFFFVQMKIKLSCQRQTLPAPSVLLS